MKIAQVAPLTESVPPKTYGGTERVVAYLAEQLVDLGHEVTLFASGDSKTKAKLISSVETALRTNPKCKDPHVYLTLLLELVRQCRDKFDLVHFHIDTWHFPLMRDSKTPHLTTLHGRQDLPDLRNLYEEFYETPVSSISYSQREPLPWINWVGNVYHGLPEDLYGLSEKPQNYLAFVGRVAPEKGVDEAIRIAIRTDIPLYIAAKVDPKDHEYFEAVIRPLIDHPLIRFMGEVSDQEKQMLLQNAFGLLFPIAWREPFGLVMIEAMACGTPVLAYEGGSVREVVEPGATGFIVQNFEEAVKTIPLLWKLNRKKIRSIFEERFTSNRMALDYVKIYEYLIEQGASANQSQIRQVK